MKILGVSLGRSGTFSLNHFLNENGIQSLHSYDYKQIEKNSFSEDINGINNHLESVLSKANAFVDIPHCFAFEHFANLYSDAKFIYIVRDVDSWVNSMININNVWKNDKDPYIFEEVYCNIYIKTNKKKIQELTESELKQIWIEHDKKINEKLGGSKNLLKVNLTDLEIGEKISSFLNIQNKTTFPWLNSIESITKAIDQPEII